MLVVVEAPKSVERRETERNAVKVPLLGRIGSLNMSLEFNNRAFDRSASSMRFCKGFGERMAGVWG